MQEQTKQTNDQLRGIGDLPYVNIKLAGVIRRCLTSRFILRSRTTDFFQTLIIYRDQLEEYFLKIGARLVVNDQLGVAYLQAIDDYEDQIGYSLGRKLRLTALDTLLLIYLRQKRLEFYHNEIDQEVPWVRTEELREFASEFDFHKEDRKFQMQFEKAIKRCLQRQILLPTAQERLYEISPVCDVLLPADQIQSIKSQADQYFKGIKKEKSILSDDQGEEGEPCQD